MGSKKRLPRMAGGSASALSLSRPARASHALRPAGSLSRPRRPLSRGSSPAGYPTEPLVSYQINRQLSGWNPPPLVIRAFGAHGRVEMWRGGCRSNISVAAPFVWRCLSGSPMAPFPHPAHRTRTCRFPASGSRTRLHAFTHGMSCPSRHKRTSRKCP